WGPKELWRRRSRYFLASRKLLLRAPDDKTDHLPHPTRVHLLVGYDDPKRPFLGVKRLPVAFVHQHDDFFRVRGIQFRQRVDRAIAVRSLDHQVKGEVLAAQTFAEFHARQLQHFDEWRAFIFRFLAAVILGANATTRQLAQVGGG